MPFATLKLYYFLPSCHWRKDGRAGYPAAGKAPISCRAKPSTTMRKEGSKILSLIFQYKSACGSLFTTPDFSPNDIIHIDQAKP